jgi:predicted TPR repeat methyltransferase
MTTPHFYTKEDLHRSLTEACRVHGEGRLAEAQKRYLILLSYLPDSSLLHYNLGLVYYDQKEYGQAQGEFCLSLASKPADADSLFNLALCQKKMGNCLAAIGTYRQILQDTPEHADCLYNLAGCYRDNHDNDQAIEFYHKVLAADSGYLPAANNLAYLYHRTGNIDQAIAFYRQVLETRPKDDSARYMLASLQGIPLDHAPESYIQDFFDTYADGFEQNLVAELGYDNPQKLYECLQRSSGLQKIYDHGLDLGCGTGLGGVPFVKVIITLDGVDLSAKMLSQAAGKGCYNKLYVDSIVHHLQSTADSYDFFLATDVFIYVGDLQEVFAAVFDCARPAAMFCFSTENLDTGGYQLRQTGRFAYSHEYIQNLAASSGWNVLTRQRTKLRQERDCWIQGDLWILQLKAIEPQSSQ